MRIWGLGLRDYTAKEHFWLGSQAFESPIMNRKSHHSAEFVQLLLPFVITLALLKKDPPLKVSTQEAVVGATPRQVTNEPALPLPDV